MVCYMPGSNQEEGLWEDIRIGCICWLEKVWLYKSGWYIITTNTNLFISYQHRWGQRTHIPIITDADHKRLKKKNYAHRTKKEKKPADEDEGDEDDDNTAGDQQSSGDSSSGDESNNNNNNNSSNNSNNSTQETETVVVEAGGGIYTLCCSNQCFNGM